MYFGLFTCKEDIEQNFRLSEGSLSEVTILCACYCDEDWSGSAFVLFERDGILYEANGSHCSCYGLEDQWEPEETTWLELYHRCTKGRLGIHGSESESFNAQLLDLIRSRWGVA